MTWILEPFYTKLHSSNNISTFYFTFWFRNKQSKKSLYRKKKKDTYLPKLEDDKESVSLEDVELLCRLHQESEGWVDWVLVDPENYWNRISSVNFHLRRFEEPFLQCFGFITFYSFKVFLQICNIQNKFISSFLFQRMNWISSRFHLHMDLLLNFSKFGLKI